MEIMEVIIGGVRYVPAKKEEVDEPAHSFKKGDWIYWDEIGDVFLIDKVEGVKLWFTDPTDGIYGFLDKRDVRLATPDEIRRYLILESHKRGFVNGAKFLTFEGQKRTIERDDEFYYNEEDDRLYSCTPQEEWKMGMSNPEIYEKGKWAEIIKQPRSLPQTVEELEAVLTDYANGYRESTYDNFNDYIPTFTKQFRQS
jgi:hypothetical protein